MKFKNKKTRKRGGEVIASGGFGCVFVPALKCKNKEREKGMVSKLFKKKYAEKEYDEIVRFKPILSKIPNYEKYFLINNVSLCQPEYLTENDLINYEDKCNTLIDDKITRSNINDSLDKIMSLNIPYGGKSVGTYVKQNNILEIKNKLNNALISLLTNGIVPMNKKNIYHCDLKDSNILVTDESTNKLITRIIDWGLSFKYVDSNEIPDNVKGRPFQFNLPFSIILFNDVFDKMYSEFLHENKKPTMSQIRAFVANYIFVWMESRGKGHIKTINLIINILFKDDLKHLSEFDKDVILELEFTYYYLINYITEILFKYTKNGKIYLNDYFKNIYLKNVDIWGLIITYLPFFEYFSDNYDNLTKNEYEIFEKLKYIYIHYLYETSITPINVNELVSDLKKINQIDISSSSPLSSKSSFRQKTMKSKSRSSSKSSKSSRLSRKTKHNKHYEKYKNLSEGDVNVNFISLKQ